MSDQTVLSVYHKNENIAHSRNIIKKGLVLESFLGISASIIVIGLVIVGVILLIFAILLPINISIIKNTLLEINSNLIKSNQMSVHNNKRLKELIELKKLENTVEETV